MPNRRVLCQFQAEWTFAAAAMSTGWVAGGVLPSVGHGLLPRLRAEDGPRTTEAMTEPLGQEAPVLDMPTSYGPTRTDVDGLLRLWPVSFFYTEVILCDQNIARWGNVQNLHQVTFWNLYTEKLGCMTCIKRGIPQWRWGNYWLRYKSM